MESIVRPVIIAVAITGAVPGKMDNPALPPEPIGTLVNLSAGSAP